MHKISKRGWTSRRTFAVILVLVGALVGVMLSSVTGTRTPSDLRQAASVGGAVAATPGAAAPTLPTAVTVTDTSALAFLDSLGVDLDTSGGAAATKAAIARLSRLGIHHVRVTPKAGTTCTDPGLGALTTAAASGLKVDLAGSTATAASLPTLAYCLGGARNVSALVAPDASAASTLATAIGMIKQFTGVSVARSLDTQAAVSAVSLKTTGTGPTVTAVDSTVSTTSGAKDLLRTFAQNAGAGVSRTYAAGSFAGATPGATTGAGAATSSFSALHNLAMLTRDTSVPATPAADATKLKLTGSADQLHRLLLRHSDGRLDLMLWRGAPGTAVTAQPVSLALSRQAKTIKVFQPGQSATPVATKTNAAGTPLIIGDQVQVVEITPAPATPPAETPAPPTTPAAPAPAPAPTTGSGGGGGGGTSGSGTSVTGPWQLAVNDDFNGSSLNAAQWGQPYNSAGNAGVGLRRPSQVTVGNGLMNIRAQYGNGTWLSGGISNSAGGSRVYGKWEVRARVDKASGVSLVGLLWPQNEQWPPEVDFAEIPSADRSSVHHVLHYDNPNTAHDQSTPGDFTQWHTFGVEWTPGKLAYTVDGRVVATDTAHVPTTPMWLGLQLDFGQCNNWQGCPQVGSFPSQGANMQVDWVHVYNYKP